MSRGRRPRVAIEEAMQYAPRFGFLVMGENTTWLPYDFVVSSGGRITIIRVRRVRYPRYTAADIAASCNEEILELRGIPHSWNVNRELWVRGPDSYWHRYGIHPDRIVTITADPSRATAHPTGQQTLPGG